MKEIELALEPITGYLISIKYNTLEGWYELEIGLPNTWVFDENNKISCEVLTENEAGKLIKIAPKKTGIIIDDLIAFVKVIIDTNKKIAEKEKQFTDKMQEMKGLLEKEAKKFYEELDDLKEKSFKKVGQNFANSLDKPKTTRKPRTPKAKVVTNEGGTTPNTKFSTVTEETETLETTKD